MRRVFPITCLLVACWAGLAQNGTDISLAPLPAAIRDAKRIFLANNGCSDRVFAAFDSALPSLGRYEIVSSSDRADLIVQLTCRVGRGDRSVWGFPNPKTPDYSHDGSSRRASKMPDPQVVLTIFDVRTKDSLWSDVDHSQLASLRKNQEKEAIKSAQRLADELRAKLAPPTNDSGDRSPSPGSKEHQ